MTVFKIKIPSQNCDKMKYQGRCKNILQPTGLKGGVSKAKVTSATKGQLQFINRGTDCFVNSVLQMLRQTKYATFIIMHLPGLIDDASTDSFKLSKALFDILSKKSLGNPMSTATIRAIVAQSSGKLYFDDNTQQDAEEFFRTLEETLSAELRTSGDFSVFRDQHWGIETHNRKFLNNSENGECHACGEIP